MKKYYFVAVVAPPEVNEKAQEMKLELFRRFGTKAAMKAPVHITLFSPFNYDPEEEHHLREALSRSAEGQEKFDVTLHNFSCFAPRVIFIDVLPSDHLKRLHASVVNAFINVHRLKKANDERNFHPHMTIGNRDWTEEAFHEAWADYKERKFAADFSADKISLLRLDDGMWKIISEAELV